MSKTTLYSILEAITSLLTVLAALPAQLGALSTIIPEQSKTAIITVGLISTAILRVIKGVNTQDAITPGGAVPALPPPPPLGLKPITDTSMGAEGNQAIAPLTATPIQPQGASIPPLVRTGVNAAILGAALAVFGAGCASVPPTQTANAKQIWLDVANVAEVGGDAAAGFYGGPTGQAVANSLFGIANQALAGQPVTAQTVQSAVTAAGGEKQLASIAGTELAKAGHLTPAQTALVVNTIGAAVQQVSNLQAK